MANVRLLRQSVETYQNALAKTGGEYQAAYDQYVKDVEAHNTAAAPYNQAVTQLQAGGVMLAVGPDGLARTYTSDGKGGVTAVGVEAGGVAAPALSSLPATADYGKDYLLRNADGTATFYSLGVPQQKGEAPVWLKNNTFKVLPDAPGPGPAEVAAPVMPKEPNITASNLREMQNPGLNQAQAQLRTAQGMGAKSELAGDAAPAMKNSVFADPQDPQGLKERGVLARVLGGQL